MVKPSHSLPSVSMFQQVQLQHEKKNASKILDSVGKPSYNQVRLRGSKYQDVELALLYWLKDMRSKDVPPPFTLTLLRGKTEKYDIFLISLNEYIKRTFGQISTQ